MRRHVHLPGSLALALFLATLLVTAVPAYAMRPMAQAVTTSTVPWAPASPPPLLPGETLWRGVPSYAFGTNETQEWDSEFTFETLPALQQAVKAAHFTLLRTWFFEHSLADGHAVTDSEQLGRVQALRNAGMTCLGELPTANSLAYDEHIVALLKGKCALYEFMNEPDDEQVTSSSYLAQWNAEIPKLRALDPSARFGGPASAEPSYNECTYYDDGTQECFMQKVLKGMAQSGVLPDFVTFHWYPCWEMSAATCLAQAGTFGQQVTLVRGWLTDYFGAAGGNIPLGITEWNADPSAPMPSYTQDATWMTTFTINAEKSMVQAGVSFANQFDLASAAGYGSDDMVDIYHNGAPKPQWNALVSLINEAYSGAPPLPPPAPAPTRAPAPTHAPTPSPGASPTAARTATPAPSPGLTPPGPGTAALTPAAGLATASATLSPMHGTGGLLAILSAIGVGSALLGCAVYLARKRHGGLP